jgi:hypothetical protein
MEEHSHPVQQKPKKWKSYFWEFVMLFLAVFSGFMAENYKDYLSEQASAKEYAKALIMDLERDTLSIKDARMQNDLVVMSIDSISEIIHRGVAEKKVRGDFYYYSQIVSFSPGISINDATFTQLTQSGNLRYFKSPEVITKISEYYVQQRYVIRLWNSESEKRNTAIQIKARVLDNYHYKAYSKLAPSLHNPKNLTDSLMNKWLPLQTNDKDVLNEFANALENRRFYFNWTKESVFPKYTLQAKELIELLKKEYSI